MKKWQRYGAILCGVLVLCSVTRVVQAGKGENVAKVTLESVRVRADNVAAKFVGSSKTTACTDPAGGSSKDDVYFSLKEPSAKYWLVMLLMAKNTGKTVNITWTSEDPCKVYSVTME